VKLVGHYHGQRALRCQRRRCFTAGDSVHNDGFTDRVLLAARAVRAGALRSVRWPRWPAIRAARPSKAFGSNSLLNFLIVPSGSRQAPQATYSEGTQPRTLLNCGRHTF
jgi:hypothetical protein